MATKPRPRASVTQFRAGNYDERAAYYDRRYHNRPPSEFTRKEMAQKLRLRAWLTAQQSLPRKHEVNGFLSRGKQEAIRRRFLQGG